MLGLLLCSVLGFGGGGVVCPDQVIDPHQMTITDRNPQICGGSLTFTYKGMTYTSPPNVCPLAIVVTPAYDGTKHVAGSNTYTKPVRTLQSTMFFYECHRYWVFGIIPIVTSVNCEQTSSQNVGAFTHYEQFPCDLGTR